MLAQVESPVNSIGLCGIQTHHPRSSFNGNLDFRSAVVRATFRPWVVPVLTFSNTCYKSLCHVRCGVVKPTTFQLEVATRVKDRRTTRRYDLSLPVLVRTSIDSEAASRTGKTQDI